MTQQGISYNHYSGTLAVLNCPLACVKAWTDEKVVLVSNYTQSGGGGGSWILVCRDRSGLLTMALTNILAVRSPFWKPKKGMICWLLRKTSITEKNVKRQQNWSPKMCVWFVPMVTNMAANPVLVLLRTMSLSIGTWKMFLIIMQRQSSRLSE